MSAICGSCEAVLDDDARWCGRCGSAREQEPSPVEVAEVRDDDHAQEAPTPVEEPSEPAEEPRRRGRWALVLGSAVAILAALVVLRPASSIDQADPTVVDAALADGTRWFPETAPGPWGIVDHWDPELPTDTWVDWSLGPKHVLVRTAGLTAMLHRDDGSVLWTDSTHRRHFTFVGSALVEHADNGFLLADPDTGEAIVADVLPGWVAGAVGRDLLVHGPGAGTTISRVDATTGTARWSRDLADPGDLGAHPRRLSVLGGRVVVSIASHRVGADSLTRVIVLDAETGDDVPGLGFTIDREIDATAMAGDRVLSVEFGGHEAMPDLRVRSLVDGDLLPVTMGDGSAHHVTEHAKVLGLHLDQETLIVDRSTGEELWRSDSVQLWSLHPEATMVVAEDGRGSARLVDLMTGEAVRPVGGGYSVGVDPFGVVQSRGSMISYEGIDGDSWQAALPTWAGDGSLGATEGGQLVAVLANHLARQDGPATLLEDGPLDLPTTPRAGGHLAVRGDLAVHARQDLISGFEDAATLRPGREVRAIVARGDELWVLTSGSVLRLSWEGEVLDGRGHVAPEDVSVASDFTVVRSGDRLTALGHGPGLPVLWEVDVPAACGSAVLAPERVAIPTRGGVHFLDPTSGEVRGQWTLESATCPGLAQAGPDVVAAAGQSVWLGTADAEPVAVGLAETVVGAPLVLGGEVVLATTTSVLGLRDGDVSWATPLDAPPIAGPTWLGDGRLGLVLADNTVVVLAQ